MVTIAQLYPELLGTYGDGGNALVLVERARRRGLDVSAVTVSLGEEVPAADLYLLGGGEDGPQRLARDLLHQSSFAAQVEHGARVLAVCAGLQILGRSFAVEGDDEYAGLGLVEATTRRGPRSVGEMASRVGGRVMVGFENHGGLTTLGAGLAPLGTMVRGRGNDGAVDGFRTDRIWATYAHGPVLAMNPWFADEILEALFGEPLAPLDSVADRLYAERCATISSSRA